jgi:hypothetical protein
MEDGLQRNRLQRNGLQYNGSDSISETSSHHDSHDSQQHDALKERAQKRAQRYKMEKAERQKRMEADQERVKKWYEERISHYLHNPKTLESLRALKDTKEEEIRQEFENTNRGDLHYPELHEKLRGEALQALGYAPDATSNQVEWHNDPEGKKRIPYALDNALDNWVQARIIQAEKEQIQGAVFKRFEETGRFGAIQDIGLHQSLQLQQQTLDAKKKRQKTGDQLLKTLSPTEGDINFRERVKLEGISEIQKAEEEHKNRLQELSKIQQRLKSKKGNLRRFQEKLDPNKRERREELERQEAALKQYLQYVGQKVYEKRQDLDRRIASREQADQLEKRKIDTAANMISRKDDRDVHQGLLDISQKPQDSRERPDK